MPDPTCRCGDPTVDHELEPRRCRLCPCPEFRILAQGEPIARSDGVATAKALLSEHAATLARDGEWWLFHMGDQGDEAPDVGTF